MSQPPRRRAATPRLLYRGPPIESLHEELAKRGLIDRAAPLVSASTLEIDAPAERVWDVLVAVSAWPTWAAWIDVSEVEAVRPDAMFRWSLNRIPIRSRFAVVEPNRELSWTGTFLGFRAIDRNVLDAIDAHRTRVTLEESLAGLFLPLLYRPRQLRSNHERWLAGLQRAVEAA